MSDPLADASGIPGEPIWEHPKKITLLFDDDHDLPEHAYVGEADRPSAVIRLLRRPADETEATIRELSERK